MAGEIENLQEKLDRRVSKIDVEKIRYKQDYIFSDKFAKSLPQDPLEGLQHLLNAADGAFNFENAEVEKLQDLYALVSTYMDERNPSVSPLPPLANLSSESKSHERQQFHMAFSTLGQQIKNSLRIRENGRRYEQLRVSYAGRFGKSIIYTLDDSQLHLIQTLINELRDRIGAARELKEEHRRRLLDRLEAMQRELNHRMSNFDRFAGLMLDVMPLAKAFGENIKPITDRCTELGNVIAQITMAFHGYPVLPHMTSKRLLLPGETQDDKPKSRKRTSKK
jgi:hypothetical protein